jgi:hypothetical protein
MSEKINCQEVVLKEGEETAEEVQLLKIKIKNN